MFIGEGGVVQAANPLGNAPHVSGTKQLGTRLGGVLRRGCA